MKPLACTLLLLAALLAAATARGAAGPAPGVAQGGDGVLAPAGDVRYVTIAAADETTVLAVGARDGRVLRWKRLRGSWGVPLVTFGGLAGGLSRDGRTLVLQQADSALPGSQRSGFALLDTARLRLLRTISLPGQLAFDALSPDARRLYLVEHPSSPDPTAYAVRAYDLASGRLEPEPIVDPRERDEKMSGMPWQRTTSADGSWIYTLYEPLESGKPFVHALDVRRGRAVCVDLPWSASMDMASTAKLALDAGGRTLTVSSGGAVVVRVDTRTFAATAT
jgi:hypothetical protein